MTAVAIAILIFAVLVAGGFGLLRARVPGATRRTPSAAHADPRTSTDTGPPGTTASVQTRLDSGLSAEQASSGGARLQDVLQEFTRDGILSPEQAAQVWRAASPAPAGGSEHHLTTPPESPVEFGQPTESGQPAGSAEPAGSGQPKASAYPAGTVRPTSSTGLIDVVGYVGGALVLGALVFLGFTLWGDLTRGAKTALAVASFLVPLAGGIVLIRSGTRRGLALVLLAIACVTAGFATHMLIDDQDLTVSAAVIVLAAAVGIAALQSPLFYLPGWAAAMASVSLLVENAFARSDEEASATGMAIGWLVVGALFVGAGLFLGRHLAWTLAGLSAWIATIPLLAFEHSYLALLLSSLVAAALFLGVIRLQMYAFAVLGCLIVLSIWPVSLYQILDTALGVALGLVAAGSVLIASAVIFARRRNRTRKPTHATTA